MGTAARRTLVAGFVVGAVGFFCGYIGPIYVTPGANQGPLVGIVFTGPAGFLIGLTLGLICGFFGLPARIFAGLLVLVSAGVGIATIWLIQP
jgi:hypothetical protein